MRPELFATWCASSTKKWVALHIVARHHAKQYHLKFSHFNCPLPNLLSFRILQDQSCLSRVSELKDAAGQRNVTCSCTHCRHFLDSNPAGFGGALPPQQQKWGQLRFFGLSRRQTRVGALGESCHSVDSPSHLLLLLNSPFA